MALPQATSVNSKRAQQTRRARWNASAKASLGTVDNMHPASPSYSAYYITMF